MSTPIPLPTAAELTAEAIARIPALAPTWTDHNPSDPGVTMLDALAWFTEAVLYRSTRLSDASRRAFLALLTGRTPSEALVGDALTAQLDRAVVELRRPRRAVTAADYVARLYDGWPGTEPARRLGRAARVGRVEVLAGVDLSAPVAQRVKSNHVSAIVVPDRLSWRWSGPATAAPGRIFLRLDGPGGAPSAVQMNLSARARPRMRSAATGAYIPLTPDADRRFQRTWRAQVPDAMLGESGELVVEAGEHGAPISIFTADVAHRTEGGNNPFAVRRSSRGVMPWLLRWIPVRRPGAIQITVSVDHPAARLGVVLFNGSNAQVKKTEGGGVLRLRHQVLPASVQRVAGQQPKDWRLAIYRRDDLDLRGHAISVRVDRYETPRAWNAGGDALLDGIWAFLDARRMLTTRHHVVANRWLRLAVGASVWLTPDAHAYVVEPRIHQALQSRFDPLTGGDDGRGWPLGRAVHATDVVACIEAVPGVDFVDGVTLSGNSGRRRLPRPDLLPVERDELPAFDPSTSTLTLHERR